MPTAGVALGGRLCVLRQREVSRGRRGTGGLQLNREVSSISRWGNSATLSRIYTSTTLTQHPTTPGATGSSGLLGSLSILERPREVTCQPGQRLIGTDLASKAVGDTGRSPNSWLGRPAWPSQFSLALARRSRDNLEPGPWRSVKTARPLTFPTLHGGYYGSGQLGSAIV